MERRDVALVVPTSGSTGDPKGVLLTAAALAALARPRPSGGSAARAGGCSRCRSPTWPGCRWCCGRCGPGRPPVPDAAGGLRRRDGGAGPGPALHLAGADPAAPAAGGRPGRARRAALVRRPCCSAGRRAGRAGGDRAGGRGAGRGHVRDVGDLRRLRLRRRAAGRGERRAGATAAGSGSAARCWLAGYRLRPELTGGRSSAAGSSPATSAGWTGGRLSVLGRADDVLVTGGEKVAPAAVAAALAEHPAVAGGGGGRGGRPGVGAAGGGGGGAAVGGRADVSGRGARRHGGRPRCSRAGGAAGLPVRRPASSTGCWPSRQASTGRALLRDDRGDDPRPVDRGRPPAHAAGRGRARARRHRRRGRGRRRPAWCRALLALVVALALQVGGQLRQRLQRRHPRHRRRAGRAAAAGRLRASARPAAVQARPRWPRSRSPRWPGWCWPR